MLKIINRIVAFAVMFCLVFEQSGFAQVAPDMNIPAYLSGLTAADKFRPMHMRWLSYDPLNNAFDLAVEPGDDAKIKEQDIKKSTSRIMEYFQIGLRLPDSMFWVNLRPDAPDQIIDPYLGRTDIGKIMLEADLQLKKDLARFTSPDTNAGREYWNKLYARAEQVFGPSDITIPTVTRPWIVPNEIIIKEYKDGAYVFKATMKVMLEQDHLKDAPGYSFDDPRVKEINEYSSELVRQLIIPQLTREVNSSKRYAGLRQVFYSLILSQWFKQRYAVKAGVEAGSEAGTGRAAAALLQSIDSRDLSGLTSTTAWSKESYFNQYVQSFQKGEYNKQETVNGPSGMTVRQYFSGGILFKLQQGVDVIDRNAPLMTILAAVEASPSPVVLRATVIGDPQQYKFDLPGAKLNISVLPKQDLQQASVASAQPHVQGAGREGGRENSINSHAAAIWFAAAVGFFIFSFLNPIGGPVWLISLIAAGGLAFLGIRKTASRDEMIAAGIDEGFAQYDDENSIINENVRKFIESGKLEGPDNWLDLYRSYTSIVNSRLASESKIEARFIGAVNPSGEIGSIGTSRRDRSSNDSDKAKEYFITFVLENGYLVPESWWDEVSEVRLAHVLRSTFDRLDAELAESSENDRKDSNIDGGEIIRLPQHYRKAILHARDHVFGYSPMLWILRDMRYADPDRVEIEALEALLIKPYSFAQKLRNAHLVIANLVWYKLIVKLESANILKRYYDKNDPGRVSEFLDANFERLSDLMNRASVRAWWEKIYDYHYYRREMISSAKLMVELFGRDYLLQHSGDFNDRAVYFIQTALWEISSQETPRSGDVQTEGGSRLEAKTMSLAQIKFLLELLANDSRLAYDVRMQYPRYDTALSIFSSSSLGLWLPDAFKQLEGMMEEKGNAVVSVKDIQRIKGYEGDALEAVMILNSLMSARSSIKLLGHKNYAEFLRLRTAPLESKEGGSVGLSAPKLAALSVGSAIAAFALSCWLSHSITFALGYAAFIGILQAVLYSERVMKRMMVQDDLSSMTGGMERREGGSNAVEPLSTEFFKSSEFLNTQMERVQGKQFLGRLLKVFSGLVVATVGAIVVGIVVVPMTQILYLVPLGIGAYLAIFSAVMTYKASRIVSEPDILPPELVRWIQEQVRDPFVPSYISAATLSMYAAHQPKLVLQAEDRGFGNYDRVLYAYPGQGIERQISPATYKAVMQSVDNYFAAMQDVVKSGWYRQYGWKIGDMMKAYLEAQEDFYFYRNPYARRPDLHIKKEHIHTLDRNEKAAFLSLQFQGKNTEPFMRNIFDRRVREIFYRSEQAQKPVESAEDAMEGGKLSEQVLIDMETWQGRLKKIQSREDAIDVGNALHGLNRRAQDFARGRFLESTSEQVKALYVKVGYGRDLQVDSLHNGKYRVTYQNAGGRKLLMNTFSKGFGANGVFIDYKANYDGDWKVYQLQDSRNVVLMSPFGNFLIVRAQYSKYLVWLYKLESADTETSEPEIVEPNVTALVPASPAAVAIVPGSGADKEGGAVGGVDFRAMPAAVIQEACAGQAGAAISAGITPVAAVDVNELDRQWADVQTKVCAGRMPYDELCAYISACCANKDARARLDKAALWVSEILKMEEDACVATSARMKDVLALL